MLGFVLIILYDLLFMPQSYILAMCHPEQTTQVSCQGKPHLDDVVLEDVERKTSAYLVRTGSQSLQVMGSEHACLLAISQLKQTYHITMVSKEAVVGVTSSNPSLTLLVLASPWSVMIQQ